MDSYEIFLFVFGTVGLVGILVRSSLVKPLREYLTKKRNKKERFKERVGFFVWFFDSVLHCEICCGVWAGLGIYGLMQFEGVIPEIIIFGLMGSYFSNILWNLSDKLKD